MSGAASKKLPEATVLSLAQLLEQQPASAPPCLVEPRRGAGMENPARPEPAASESSSAAANKRLFLCPLSFLQVLTQGPFHFVPVASWAIALRDR
jgi:hypothetical protein